jgi:hypothetical protein
MKYMLLIYESPRALAERDDSDRSGYIGAWHAYQRALAESGAYVDARTLELPETATTVRLVGGQRHIQDGPYADTKEQLGAFIILELPSLDAALDWAARCPAAGFGAVEVRPISAELAARIER